MNIVIDTNVLVSDFRLTAPRSQLFLDHIAKLEATLVVPEVVLDEAVQKFREDLLSQHETVSKGLRRASYLLGTELVNPVRAESMYELVGEYRDFLSRRLNEVSHTMTGYPTESHKTVASRAIRKVRPFASKGGGYRDYLVWLNVRQVLSSTRDLVVFVTANTADFMSHGSLHPDLADDLLVDSVSEARLHLCT